MAKIKARANKLGYVDHKRIREGQIFEIDEKFFKYDKDGVQIAPLWCVPVDEKKAAQKSKEKIELPKASSDEVI